MKTKAEIEAALKPSPLGTVDGWPRERTGMLNAYKCDKCAAVLVVVLLDWGTTPFIVACEDAGRNVTMRPGVKRDRYCKGSMTSAFYRIAPEWAQHLTHAFYRPDDTGPALVSTMERIELNGRRYGAPPESIEAARRQTIEHVERGGLLLRELTPEERTHWRRRCLQFPSSDLRGPGRFA